MRKLTNENTANAVNRNFERKCFVRLVNFEGHDRARFHVRCDEGHVHTVDVELRPDGLYAECFFEETGELCPSEQGSKVCYHRTGAAALFNTLRSRKTARAAIPATRRRLGNVIPLAPGVTLDTELVERINVQRQEYGLPPIRYVEAPA